jgi:hypothetical protein
MGGMSSSTMRNMAVIDMSSAYGGLPEIISMMVHPRDQMSLAVEAPCSRMTSGAIQQGVPDISGLLWTALRLRLTPKSAPPRQVAAAES